MDHIPFLNTLRAVACLMVVFCHLIGFRAPPDWFVRPYIDAYVVDPLHVMWQFGYVGVAIFFVISGFIIAHIAQREGRRAFIIKRIFRVYPPFLVALGIATLVGGHGTTFTDWLLEASLFGSSFTILSPSYTLVMELTFYALAAAMLPWFRDRPVLATSSIALFPLSLHLMLGEFFVSLGSSKIDALLGYASFISIFSVGMAIYYGWSGRIGPWTVFGMCLASWCVFIWTRGAEMPDTHFALNSLYAGLIFLTALWVKARGGGLAEYIADRSYSIYLLHLPLGGITLSILQPYVGYSAALLLALILVSIGSTASFRFIEQPSQRLARSLVGRNHR